MEPLLLNTLQEAADWISEKAKYKITPKQILNTEISLLSKRPSKHHRPPKSSLFVALPRDAKFSVFKFEIGDGFVFKRYANWQLVPLYKIHLWELLIHGETNVSIAQYEDDEGDDGYVLVEPTLKGRSADLSMIRIKGVDLIKLLKEFSGFKGGNLRLTPVQQDKINCQSEARKLWQDNPNLTQKDIKNSSKVAAYLVTYKGKNTVSGWLSEIDPRPKNARAGRPKNTPPAS